MGWESNDFDWMADSGYDSGPDPWANDYGYGLDVTTDNYENAWGGWDSGSNFDSGGASDWFNNDFNGMNNIGADLSNPSYNFNYTQPQSNTFGFDTVGGSIKNVLNDLFTKGTISNTVGQGLVALASGYQNNKRARAAQDIAKQIDPWAGQRSFYQQQAKQAVTDPYSSPIVMAQIAQLQNAQNIKDAAAGRRSNLLTSSPAVQAQMAQIAQAYQQQMANQGGAQIQPSGLANVLQTGANTGAEGYISPIANLFGNQTQSNTNDKRLEALSKFFSQG